MYRILLHIQKKFFTQVAGKRTHTDFVKTIDGYTSRVPPHLLRKFRRTKLTIHAAYIKNYFFCIFILRFAKIVGYKNIFHVTVGKVDRPKM